MGAPVHGLVPNVMDLEHASINSRAHGAMAPVSRSRQSSRSKQAKFKCRQKPIPLILSRKATESASSNLPHVKGRLLAAFSVGFAI